LWYYYSEQNFPNALTEEKAAEIAADFMGKSYQVEVGASAMQEFRTTPVPFWLVERVRQDFSHRNAPAF
jgi:hypothetical protein